MKCKKNTFSNQSIVYTNKINRKAFVIHLSNLNDRKTVSNKVLIYLFIYKCIKIPKTILPKSAVPAPRAYPATCQKGRRAVGRTLRHRQKIYKHVK